MKHCVPVRPGPFAKTREGWLLGEDVAISNIFELVYVCRRAWDRQGVCGGEGHWTRDPPRERDVLMPRMSVSEMLHFPHLTATAPRQTIEADGEC
jgi:hypothetical protein